MSDPPTYRILVRLPDRPGALGAAASRIGALRGDVVGFEILQRAHGAALDEFVVALPVGVPLDLLVRELTEDGMTVLDIAEVDADPLDSVVVGLSTARSLVGCISAGGDAVVPSLSEMLVATAARLLRADWVWLFVDRDDPDPPETPLTGEVVPSTRWERTAELAPDGARVRELIGDRPNSPPTDALDQPMLWSSVLLPGTDDQCPGSATAAGVSDRALLVVGRSTSFGSAEQDRLTALTDLTESLLGTSMLDARSVARTQARQG